MSEVPQTRVMIFQIACPDGQTAAQIGAALVEAGLAACTHVLPPHDSRYRWEDAIVCETEVTLLAKTRADLADALARKVTSLHPYDVPAILGNRLDYVNAAYADWVRAETTKA